MSLLGINRWTLEWLHNLVDKEELDRVVEEVEQYIKKN